MPISFMNKCLEDVPNTSLENFMDALQNRATIGRVWNNFFDKYPLILCPITAHLPFPDLKDLESPESFDMVFDSMLPQIAPSIPWASWLIFCNRDNEL